jgi:hypothetical protein
MDIGDMELGNDFKVACIQTKWINVYLDGYPLDIPRLSTYVLGKSDKGFLWDYYLYTWYKWEQN